MTYGSRCVFRPIPATDSDASRPPIQTEPVHCSALPQIRWPTSLRMRGAAASGSARIATQVLLNLRYRAPSILMGGAADVSGASDDAEDQRYIGTQPGMPPQPPADRLQLWHGAQYRGLDSVGGLRPLDCPGPCPRTWMTRPRKPGCIRRPRRSGGPASPWQTGRRSIRS